MILIGFINFHIGRAYGIRLGIEYHKAKILEDDVYHTGLAGKHIEAKRLDLALDDVIAGLAKHQPDDSTMTFIGELYEDQGKSCCAVPWFKAAIDRIKKEKTNSSTRLEFLEDRKMQNVIKCEEKNK